MSNFLGSVLCTQHDDSSPSMAVYENEDGSYSCHCFTCKFYSRLSKAEAHTLLDSMLARGSGLKRKHVTSHVEGAIESLNERARRFLQSRNVEEYWATDYGVGIKEGRLYLPCLDRSRREIGYQLRALNDEYRPKVEGRHKDGIYPGYSQVYGYDGLWRYERVALVESIIDGLSVWSRYRVPSIALLGTHPRPGFWRTLVDVYKSSSLLLLFDNDEAGDEGARFLLDKLKVLGYSNSKRVDVTGRVWESELCL